MYLISSVTVLICLQAVLYNLRKFSSRRILLNLVCTFKLIFDQLMFWGSLEDSGAWSCHLRIAYFHLLLYIVLWCCIFFKVALIQTALLVVIRNKRWDSDFIWVNILFISCLPMLESHGRIRRRVNVWYNTAAWNKFRPGRQIAETSSCWRVGRRRIIKWQQVWTLIIENWLLLLLRNRLSIRLNFSWRTIFERLFMQRLNQVALKSFDTLKTLLP